METVPVKKKRGRPRKSEVTLGNAKKSTAATEARIYEISRLIANFGFSRLDCIDYMVSEWGLSQSHSEKYYYSALSMLIPKEPEKYREALINRNFNTAEKILQKALAEGDLGNANAALKILNQMLGVGSKSVEVKDKNENIIRISFND